MRRLCFIYSLNDELLSSPPTAAVQGVTVAPLTDTSVTVSWSPVVIPNFPIESYTVVYSPVSESDRRQDGEMTAEFPGSVTSGVITDLDPALSYQFQVFATVTVDGVSLEGERSTPDTTCKEYSPYCIAGNFRGLQFSRIRDAEVFRVLIFEDRPNETTPPNFNVRDVN